MLIVGLTGGIGSGKSLAAEYFVDLGAQVIDADDLARKAIERGSTGFNLVVAAFGDSILKDGDINRKVLAQEIFANPIKRKILEAIVHPRVQEIFEGAVRILNQGDILIYEIPLLAESGSRDRFDFVITVEAPLEDRVERLRRRGMLESDIEARISSQATSDARREIADLVIENDGTPEELFQKIEKIWTGILPKIEHRKT